MKRLALGGCVRSVVLSLLGFGVIAAIGPYAMDDSESDLLHVLANTLVGLLMITCVFSLVEALATLIKRR